MTTRKFNKQERDRIAALRRRRQYLLRQLDCRRPDARGISYIKAEVGALRWALDLIEKEQHHG